MRQDRTLNVNFGANCDEEFTPIRKLHDKAVTSGTIRIVGRSDEEELEQSPKRLCRDQTSTRKQ